MQVALLLGYRSSRHPCGYWDQLEALEAELEQFVRASWLQLPHPEEPEDVYYYNMVSGGGESGVPKHGGRLSSSKDWLHV
jgi:hypothetical protein